MHENKVFSAAENVGEKMSEVFHLVGLFLIGVAIMWATVAEVISILSHGSPEIKDILLLFIYLELGAMVGIYFRTRQLPVRFLIYIAITALTRILAIDIKTMGDLHIIVLTVSILALSLSVVALRFASHKFPSKDASDV